MNGKWRQRWIRPCVGLALLLSAVGLIMAIPAAGTEDSMETALIVLPGGDELVVELAVSLSQRSRGLMFREELPREQGMLLVFPDSGFRSIWMKNVKFPLDLIWLDRSNRVVHLEPDVPPCLEDPCPDYHSLRKASAVLELNAGAVEKWGIELGQQLEIIPPLH